MADPTFRCRAAANAIALVCSASAPLATVAASCSAQSADAPPTVVELYTSEGCSSCPPADRWLSSLERQPGVVPLAFHVDYWESLGWRDRFASAANSQRQREVVAASGGKVVYTPQVMVDGRDWRGWPAWPKAAKAMAVPISARLERDGDRVTARIGSAPVRLAGYWALVEDGHSSQVRAGENAGTALRHDHVVRRYEPIAAWDGRAPRDLHWRVEARGAAPTRVVLVLTDPLTHRPLQAVVLDC